MSAESDLVELVQKIANEYWESNQAPILLSKLPYEITQKNPDYKKILGEKRNLKKFIEETKAEGKYKIIKDPQVRARIGLAPETADFSYPVEEATLHSDVSFISKQNSMKTKQSREAVFDFLNAVSLLSEIDQDKIVIPLSIFIKLIDD